MGEKGGIKMNNLIKIKQFSELVGFSIRTLQYYDEIGLLIPEKVDEHGHRYYGDQNFITAFIINSLKQIGMSLKDIRNYLLSTGFSMSEFIKTEKNRLEDEINVLQHRMITLEAIEHYEQTFSLEDPKFISLFSHANIDKVALKKILDNSSNQLTFNLAETTQFLTDLNYCQINNLPIHDPLAKKCATYWQNMLHNLGENQHTITKAAEKNYQTETNTYGMTGENYRYLKALIDSI